MAVLARSVRRGRSLGPARRAWSRRGRRAQASAIATLLGLLLLVTMIANYLGTELPATMALNDADHALAVEGQVSRFGALLEDAANDGAVGAVLTQPVTLGSMGDPPFAPGDGSVLGPLTYVNETKGVIARPDLTVSYKVTGTSGSVPQPTTGAPGATFAVELKNTYTPDQVIAFDEGAIIYAQPSGVPLVLVGPSLSFIGGNLTLWVPEFLNTIGTEAGTGNAELSARLASVLDVDLPSTGTSLSGSTSVAVTTPYAEAWYSYFLANATLSSSVACEPKSVCDSTAFSLTGSLGTVYLNVTATALDLEVATYGLSLN